MLTTFTALVALLLLVLPGFVLVQLQEARRARRPSDGDLETVLRALFYAIVIQALVALTGWSDLIYNDVRSTTAWHHHAQAIALYILATALVIPTLAGLLLGGLLRKLERDGELKWWALALGARDARHGWDRAFGEQLETGSVLVIHPKTPVVEDAGASAELSQSQPSVAPTPPPSWRTLIGVFGEQSWASQTPAQDGHDLWLERVEPGDIAGSQIGKFATPRGLWIAREEIAHLYVVHPVAVGGRMKQELAEPTDADHTVG
jgi:hypothetical protein